MKNKKTGMRVVLVCMAVLCLPLQARPRISGGEIFYYTETMGDKRVRESNCFYSVNESGYEYFYQAPGEQWLVRTDTRARPLGITHRIEGNELVFDYSDTSVRMKGMWKGTSVADTQSYPSFVTGENALLLRTHDFDAEKSFSFLLMQPDGYPKQKVLRMKFTWVGNETVTVPAGTFDCRKICFSMDGAASLLFRAHYYISNDERQIIVKSDNMPLKGSTQLVKIEQK